MKFKALFLEKPETTTVSKEPATKVAELNEA
jgi:hypothetical protein